MDSNITPTYTLAQLFETQNQLIDALIIYQKLNKLDSSLENEKKIEELIEKIFSNIKEEYNPVIDLVFTAEEKRHFRILPHSEFIALTKASDENQEDFSETMNNIDELSEEEILKDIGKDIDLEKFTNPTEEPEINIEQVIRDEDYISLDKRKQKDLPVDDDRYVQLVKPERVEPEGLAASGLSDEEKPSSEKQKQDQLNSEIEAKIERENSIIPILEEIKNIDQAEFENFLKKTFGKERDLSDFKLSQIHRAISLYKKDS
ncbi:MAG: hypothetical protein JW996_02695 [Candidatus Cloacimonetes bacterium]|nr:hypothetical protein [Candidatus Cloacimonadota bacterium]